MGRPEARTIHPAECGHSFCLSYLQTHSSHSRRRFRLGRAVFSPRAHRPRPQGRRPPRLALTVASSPAPAPAPTRRRLESAVRGGGGDVRVRDGVVSLFMAPAAIQAPWGSR